MRRLAAVIVAGMIVASTFGANAAAADLPETEDPDDSPGAVLTPAEAPGCYETEVTGINIGEPVQLPFSIEFGYESHDQVYAGVRGVLAFRDMGTTWSQPLEGQDDLVWEVPLIAAFSSDNSAVNFQEDGRSPTPVTYGFTTYQGHDALCVTWNHVNPWVPDVQWVDDETAPEGGHWIDAGGWDTTLVNHFQALLVDRSDLREGFADIVLNYDTIQWQEHVTRVDLSQGEDGEHLSDPQVGVASGMAPWNPVCAGSYACWIGYVTGYAGDGEEMNGITPLGYPDLYCFVDQGPTNEAFLDSEPTGLAKTSTASLVVGRHKHLLRFDRISPTLLGFEIDTWLRNWQQPADACALPPWGQRTWVALGDSFQSGEGTLRYYANTDLYSPDGGDEPSNLCHRSPDAYPVLVSEDDLFGGLILEFWACSGSKIEWMYKDEVGSRYGTFWSDPALSTWYDSERSGSLTSPLERLGEETAVVTIGIGGNDLKLQLALENCLKYTAARTVADLRDKTVFSFSGVCEGAFGDDVLFDLIKLTQESVWTELFDEIHKNAPNARVYVVGYPRFFEEEGGAGGHAIIRKSDQVWANSVIYYMNQAIERSVVAQQRKQRFIQYIDIYDSTEGHEIFSSAKPSDWFAQGLYVDLSTVGRPASGVEGAFHPKDNGHEMFAEAFSEQVRLPREAKLGYISEGETITATVNVHSNMQRVQQTLGYFAPILYFSVLYRGSDIEMTLISPSGQRYTRDTVDPAVTSSHGPTWDDLEIANPEVGEWTIELYGAEIDPGGEPFELRWFADEGPNERPVAIGTVTQTGRTVTVDGSASYDPDGEIVEQYFDFGDGTVMTGSHATHTYAQGGDVLITTWVVDDLGEPGFSSVGTVLSIPAPPGAFSTGATGGAQEEAGASLQAPTPSSNPDASSPLEPSASPTAPDGDEPPASAGEEPTSPGPDPAAPFAWWFAAAAVALILLLGGAVMYMRRPTR